MNPGISDIIVAPATTPGTGAISVIRLSGSGTLELLDRVVVFVNGNASGSEGFRIKFGKIEAEGEIIDEVLVSIFRAPHSYTGEDSAEISCHASFYIVNTILQILCDAGARAAGPGEFTRRAFVNGRMDLSQAEAVADVIAASGKASLKVAMNQMRGGYSSSLKELREHLVRTASLMELELDFSEEDVQFADRPFLVELLDEGIGRISSLADSFKQGNAIRNGIPVAIAGGVNTGKSTLLNALLNEDRAIVSDVAGTTRDTVEEVISLEGIQFRFIDTAGIRSTPETVEKMGIERTLKKISEAPVVLGMVSLTSPPEKIGGDIREIASKMDLSSQKLIVLLNKKDLYDIEKEGESFAKIISVIDSFPGTEYLAISAKEGSGLGSLRKILLRDGSEIIGSTDETMVTNLRHYNALHSALKCLKRVRNGVDASLSTELLAQDLREALWHLGTITGEITTDEVLGEIFDNFCIGK